MSSSADRPLLALATADQAPVYNTAAASRRTGLPPATLRAWERRYGFPAPGRGPGNQRGYSERDLLGLRWLRDRLAEGLTISAAVALLREQLAQQTTTAPTHARSPARIAEELERALLHYDGLRAEALLAEAYALYPIEQVCLEVMQVTLISIGEGWHAGVVQTAQEHFASGFIRGKLTDLLEAARPHGGQRLVVAACAPDDWHELGLLMVAVFLARRSWQVVYLGASLPTEGLAETLVELRPDAVVISATTEQTVAGVLEVAQIVQLLPSPRPLLGFGGVPFEQDAALREAIPGVYLGPNGATAAERLEAALADATAAWGQ
jgi:MerR family transcriptional regulator, light-induced transcriptional regulator